MIAGIGSSLPGPLRRWPYRSGSVLVLIVALVVTWGMRQEHVDRVAREAEARQAQRAETTLDNLAREFFALQRTLRARAESLADRSAVREGLQAARTDSLMGSLVAYAAGLQLPDRVAIEVYDDAGRLRAWTGYSMPLKSPPSDAAQRPGLTEIVSDEGVRQALVAWWPVQADGRIIGAVRAMRLVSFQVPVQNQFVSDYSLAEGWEQQTGYAIDLRLGTDWSGGGAPHQRVLGTLGGRVLGGIVVQLPTGNRLAQVTRRSYNNVLALWVTLLLFILLLSGWQAYRQAAHPPPGEEEPQRRVGPMLRFTGWALSLVGVRYLLLAMDVPARWQPGTSKAPLAPLFDPTHFASAFGAGIARSTGDLLITGLFLAVFALAFLDAASHVRVRAGSVRELVARLRKRARRPSVLLFLGGSGITAASITLLGLGLAQLAQRAVLDSTLDFFARTGLLPSALVLVVLCALLIITVSTVLIAAGIAWIAVERLACYRPAHWSSWGLLGAGFATGTAATLATVGGWGLQPLPTTVTLAFGGAAAGVALLGMLQQVPIVTRFTLRSLLPAVILFTTLLYPLLYSGMDQQRRGRMIDAAQSFAQGQDPHVLFALEQALRAARQDSSVRRALATPGTSVTEPLTTLLRESLVASLNTFEVSVTVFDRTRRPAERLMVAASRVRPTERRAQDTVLLGALQQRPEAQGRSAFVTRLPDARQARRFQYAGIAALPAGQDTAGWMLVRAEPLTVLPSAGAPFPRVFLPDGLYSDIYAELSLAEFRDGTLVRSLGPGWGRTRLAEAAQAALQDAPDAWQRETEAGRSVLTYYTQRSPQGNASASVVAARVPVVSIFDHLYYLLRLAVAGLCVGVPLYLLGLYLRYRQGRLPAPRIRFRDKVLDAFLTVGAVAVVAVGLVGVGVVTGETDNAVKSLLRQNLERVEETLLAEARPDELLYSVIERIGIDALSARVGVDLNLYRGAELVASSRPRIVRNRLVEARLPIEAYQALYVEAQRFAAADEQYGNFGYTLGFRTLPNAEGAPAYVLSIPTLPEQERIKEERARTLAYLFGALLLLVVVVMGTALFLANALTKPIARLRAGLEAVGEGRFAQALPVDTRDEIGELVETFNEMREQLAESRRKLAQQERQLAWREMARQVAHEIKNPLTPMKLSVQHLRRAYDRLEVPASTAEDQSESSADKGPRRFEPLFERITGTLIEQIDALARIANEFSSFARLPTRVSEPLDLNEVIEEAAALMQEESDVTIDLQLHPEPLVVEADKEELRRIYINLIKNAIQAIPEGRDGQIQIATHPEADPEAENGAPAYARSTVADNGMGIPLELREKIFQPNFSTKTSGTGLGLAIAQRSVEEASGAIGFETTEGEGTTFWIRLPLAEVA